MLRNTFSLVILFFFLVTTYGQGSDTLYLWPDEVPGESEAKHPAVQTEDTHGDVIRLTDVTDPILVVFEAEKKNDKRTGVIVCPGGGYHILAIDKEGYEVAEWLNDLGYTAFVLQYRVPGKREGALMDVQRAIRMLRGKADQFRIAPERIGVLGFSAGGSLSARAATRFNEELYPAQDKLDDLSSRPDFVLLIYPAYLDEGPQNTLTLELTLTKESPPFFIFAAANDSHSNSPLVFAKALRDQKIPVEFHLMPTGGHGYGMRSGNSAAEIWPVFAEDWLRGLKF